MRRANGTGAIVKRRDTKRRKPYTVYINGRDDFGKRIRSSLGSFESHREAQDFLEKYNQGVVTVKPADETTLKDVWDLYKENIESQGKKIHKSYTGVWNNHIQPKLGSAMVSSIKALHMQNVINQCKYPSTQRHIKSVLANLFEIAIANDLATKDYTTALTTAEIKKSTLHRPFTTEEMRLFWSNVDTNDVYKVVLILCYTGMRRAELEGMLIKNVDLKNKLMIGGVKTDAGRNRTIPIADCILPLVRHFYTISRFAQFPFLIMPDRKRHLPRVYDKMCIGMMFWQNFKEPKHTAHDTRHTFVSLCSNYNVPEAIAKKIVGHAGGNVTEAIYTHKTLQQMHVWLNNLPFGPKMYMSPEEKTGCHVAAT